MHARVRVRACVHAAACARARAQAKRCKQCRGCTPRPCSKHWPNANCAPRCDRSAAFKTRNKHTLTKTDTNRDTNKQTRAQAEERDPDEQACGRANEHTHEQSRNRGVPRIYRGVTGIGLPSETTRRRRVRPSTALRTAVAPGVLHSDHAAILHGHAIASIMPRRCTRTRGNQDS